MSIAYQSSCPCFSINFWYNTDMPPLEGKVEGKAGKLPEWGSLPVKTMEVISRTLAHILSFEKNRIPKTFIPLLFGISMLLSQVGCRAHEKIAPPTPEVLPASTPSSFILPPPNPWGPILIPETPSPQPTPTIEGSTIHWKTLAIGGGETLNLKTISGENLTNKVEAGKKSWLIVTDEKGDSSFFVGYVGAKGKEVQKAVLTQAPPGFSWDEKNFLWKNGKEVFIPDVLLPGNWYQEKNMAGPSHEADIVFLLKDENGDYRVGIIYGKEKMPEIPDKSKLIFLPDGSGLYIGGSKNFKLLPGQDIIRDTDSNLRLINPDGSWRLMRTSWSSVTSPDQLYQAGAFTGPLKAQPTLPYPSEKLLDTTSDAPLVQYAKAFGLNADQVRKGLTYQERNDKDGKPFYVLVTKDATPLFLATKNEKGEWGWKEATSKEAKKISGINTTVHVDDKRVFWDESNFWQTGGSLGKFIKDNYTGVSVPFFMHQIYPNGESGDFNWSRAHATLTKGMDNPNLIGTSLLYGLFVPDWIKRLPREQRHEIMIKKISEMIGNFPKINNWIVVNEPLAYGDYWYNTFGSQYIIEAFQQARNLAPSANLILNGIDVGPDFLPDHNLEKISDGLIPIITDLRKKGLIDEIGIECHLTTTREIPTEDALVQYFQRVRNLTNLPVRLTEVDVDIRNLTGPDRFFTQASIYKRVIRAYIRSGVGSNINFWGIRDKDSWREDPIFGGSENADANLFDDRGNPKPAYYAVLSALFFTDKP